MKIRQQDAWGDGRFGASRGGRTHNGVDLAIPPNELFTSPVDGKVTKIGWPYRDPDRGYIRYVQIEANGYNYRFFYLNPLVKVGDTIFKGDIIGSTQSLDKYYPGITEHVHFEIIHNDEYINPTPFVAFI